MESYKSLKQYELCEQRCVPTIRKSLFSGAVPSGSGSDWKEAEWRESLMTKWWAVLKSLAVKEEMCQ